MRNRLIDGILQLPKTRLNGDREKRLPGNLNISIEGIEGESLLLMLDLNGICASSGSACTSGSLDPSHVLLALGLKHEVAHGSLRMSIDETLTDEDVDAYATKLGEGYGMSLTEIKSAVPTDNLEGGARVDKAARILYDAAIHGPAEEEKKEEAAEKTEDAAE